MSFPRDAKIKDLKKLEQFKEVGDYIIYMPGIFGVLMGSMKINQVEKAGWNSESLIYGLERLEEVTAKGQCLYRVYTDGECKDDKNKKDVNVIFFPKTEDHGTKPVMVVCAGGGYMGVCTAVEGFPVAARFNELGYDVFLVTYRVSEKKIMPRPIDDLAASLRFIFTHKEQFGIGDEYVLCGFSAGANLISLFGTENLGYKTYGLPKPKAMIPVYTFVDNSLKGDSKVMKACLKTMYGKDPSAELLSQYNVCEHLGDYPPCYLVCGKNDSTVPPSNSELLEKCLKEQSIPVVLEEGEQAEHGFGEGRGTSVEGWYLRADAFISGLA